MVLYILFYHNYHIMDDLPNDIYREIMKLLDSTSICNLYMAHKLFWVLTKEQINYHRLVYKVSPHERDSNGLMLMSYDQMLWISNKLTAGSKMQILMTNTPFCKMYYDGKFNNLRLYIYHLQRKGVKEHSVYLKMGVKYDFLRRFDRQSPSNFNIYDVIISSTELAKLIINQ